MLVSVTVCDCWAPTVTLPKPSLAGLVASVPEAGPLEVPVPESRSCEVGLDASLLVIVTAAVKAPGALGVNLMLIGVVCPAATVIGRLGDIREKYLLEMAALLTVSDAFPEFVALTDTVLLLPLATLPKFRLEFARERPVGSCWLPAALTPWQPTRTVRPAIRSNAPASFPR